MTIKKELLQAIKEQRISSKDKKKFEGTFIDYIELLQESPDLVKSSHKRLYQALVEHGFNTMSDSDPRKKKIFDNNNIKIYDYFKDEFFGMENVIMKIMRFLKAAAFKGEESRQVLLLMGPVGAGKSALTEHIKSSLEGISYFHLKDDPQRGEPLQLVPRTLRDTFSKKLGVAIEGDISPVARHKLLTDYGGKYEDFSIVESTFSQRGRRGVASVPPMDANSQDVSVLNLINTQKMTQELFLLMVHLMLVTEASWSL